MKHSTAGKFTENSLGSDLPFALKNRFALEAAGLGRLFVMTDHDPREVRIFDLMKFSGEINAISVFPQIVFGAVRMDLGQGLLYSTEKDFLSGPFTQFRSAARQAGIRPDSGFREIHPVGVGVHFLIPHFRILGFAGKTSYDAKVSPATSFGEFATVPNFSDLDLDHTNAAALMTKQALDEWVGCLDLEWFGEGVRISLSGMASRFSIPLGDLEHGEKLRQSGAGLSGSFVAGDERRWFFGEGALQFVNPMEAASPLFVASSNLEFAFRTGFAEATPDGDSQSDRTE
ncbi:MAG: hypothetical protein JNM63_13905, partial [Spirochaetia bacterium]|nr:hypothetical protein [Spirochaetia bacterium]